MAQIAQEEAEMRKTPVMNKHSQVCFYVCVLVLVGSRVLMYKSLRLQILKRLLERHPQTGKKKNLAERTQEQLAAKKAKEQRLRLELEAKEGVGVHTYTHLESRLGFEFQTNELVSVSNQKSITKDSMRTKLNVIFRRAYKYSRRQGNKEMQIYTTHTQPHTYSQQKLKS